MIMLPLESAEPLVQTLARPFLATNFRPHPDGSFTLYRRVYSAISCYEPASYLEVGRLSAEAIAEVRERGDTWHSAEALMQESLKAVGGLQVEIRDDPVRRLALEWVWSDITRALDRFRELKTAERESVARRLATEHWHEEEVQAASDAGAELALTVIDGR